ncbi:transcription factor bHLH110-like [Lycium ferocissimum]|uniref:transcription factor bHLH110-like n=1 Tax=Lycium ferocissimum TaxID=112874 RepID=UPI002815E9B7|nr:transcription factor bHLH110-like [Lycium ferocissimum]
MDSANLYHYHQLIQHQQVAGYPFFNGVSTIHDWNSSMTSEEEYYYRLGHMKRIQNNISSEEQWKRSNIDTFPLTNTSTMFHDGQQLSNDQLDYKNNNDYFDKMKDMNGLSNSLFKESCFGHEQQHAFDLNENLLSEDSYMNNAKTSIGFPGKAAHTAVTNSSYISSYMEHSNFQGLKLAFNGLTFKNSSGHGSNIFGHFSTDRMSSGFAAGLQELTHSPSNSTNKTTSNVRNNIGVSTKAKRCNYSAEESPCQEATKKPRVTSQSSSPMLKVRKEKLGDRISALHRLVAPFGKTDTASVLTEAIGYIQFLQDQILTLSTPYTKSSQGKLHQINLKDSSTDVKGQEAVLDLKSRGLCLVPISLSSYITSSCD